MIWGMVCKPSMRSFLVAEKVYPLLDGEVMLEKKIAAHMSRQGYPIKEIGEKADRILIVGGDGTILMVMRYTTKPVFTINTGAVGFLAEVEEEGAVEGVKKILAGHYFVDDRMRIKAVLNGERLPDATNEVVVHVSNVGKILSMGLLVDGVVTEEIDGNGIIIATPTGSTSYSFSVGGPIVDPSIDAFIVAPVAPFRHIASPLVIPAGEELQVKIRGKKSAKVIIDGIRAGVMSSGDELILSMSERKSSFIRLEDNFYSRVYDMLSFRGKRTENGEDKGD